MNTAPHFNSLKNVAPSATFKYDILKKIEQRKASTYPSYSPKWTLALTTCVLLIVFGVFYKPTHPSALELNTFEVYGDCLESKSVAEALLYH